MSSQHSSSESTSFLLLDTRIQQWIWHAGWTELKDAQEEAIPVILEGKKDLIIASATASGKTEAAFFPILTKMLSDSNSSISLYISPLKALINDQWGRLERLCESLNIQVIPWHGDISAALKKKFTKNPTGCLLITPESLEGILMREGHSLSRLFGNLHYIVVDELHAFIDTERGKQLQSLMYRIDLALKRHIPRIGLSATLGEMQLAAEFLNPIKSKEVKIINSISSGQELKVLVKGFYNKPKNTDRSKLKKQQSSKSINGTDEEQVEGLATIGNHLFNALHGSNNLIFPNSRSLVEFFADLLRRTCEQNGIANEFWPHHGSLSKTLREETEQALKAGDRPATAIATTTLELGIDIGTVKSIAQIGPAPSVASLRQRLGRSGRKKGEAAILRCYNIENLLEDNAPLADRLHEGLVQSIAQIQLLVKNWFEPPRAQSLHLSTLIQQFLSLIAQYGGLHPDQAWSFFNCSGLFTLLSKTDFTDLIRELCEKDIIMQDPTGLLLNGTVGEKLVNHYSFLSAFISPEEFRLVCEGKLLGTLPLERPIITDSFLIFAGRRWKVIDCSPVDKLIQVVPARGGKVPLFDGMGGKVHDQVRQEMRALLRDLSIVPFLDALAMSQLQEAREIYQHLSLDTRQIIQGEEGIQVLTWQGDWVNDTLAIILQKKGFHAMNHGVYINVIQAKLDDIQKALCQIADESNQNEEVLASFVANKLMQKWDHLLPESLLNKNYASSEFDVPAAIETAKRIVANS